MYFTVHVRVCAKKTLHGISLMLEKQVSTNVNGYNKVFVLSAARKVYARVGLVSDDAEVPPVHDHFAVTSDRKQLV